MTPETDRNLLFGVLAMQLELLSERHFAEICATLSTRRDTPFADLLAERGWLNDEDRHDIERLLDRKLQKHRGDVRSTLAEVSADYGTVLNVLVTDEELRKSFAAHKHSTQPPNRVSRTLILFTVIFAIATVAVAVRLGKISQSHQDVTAELQRVSNERDEALQSKLIAERVRDKAQSNQKESEEARTQAIVSQGESQLSVGILSSSGDDPASIPLTSSAAAVAAFEQSLSIRRALAEDDPLSVEYAAAVAETLYHLGLHLQSVDDSPKATRQFRETIEILSRLSTEQPDSTEHSMDLAHACYQMGNQLRRVQDYESAVDWYTQGVTATEAVLADSNVEPDDQAQSILKQLLVGRASLLGKMNQNDKAIESWDRVVELESGSRQREIRVERVLTRAAAGDHAQAASEATELLAESDLSADRLFGIATVFAKAASAVDSDEQLADETREALRLEYSNQTVSSLDRGINQGLYSDIIGKPILASTMVTYLKNDAAFEALREHDGFKAFLARIEGIDEQEPTGQEPTGQEPTGQEPTGQEPTGQEPTGQEPTEDGSTEDGSTEEESPGE